MFKTLGVAGLGVTLSIVPTAASCAPSRAGTDLSALRIATNCHAWPALGTVRVTGAFQEGRVRGTFDETFDARTGRFIRLTHAGSLALGAGRDTTDWARDVTGAAHRYDSASARGRAITDAWLARRDWCRPDAGPAQIRFAYSRVEDGTSFDVLIAQPPNGQPVKLWIDTRSHLLARVEERKNENTEIDSYSDWRTVGDAIVPFEERDDQPEDGGSETYRIRTLTRIVVVASQTFAPPALPHDVAMLHGATYARVPYVEEALKPYIPVYLNGAGPFPFEYDTGGHFMISDEVRKRLGIPDVLGGARIRSLRIGDAVVSSDVAQIRKGEFRTFDRGPRPRAAGLLGLDILERFESTFDPATHSVILRPLTQSRPMPAGVRFAMTFDEDAPFIDCRVDGIPGPCMLDTGNGTPTIVEGYWAARHGLAARYARGLPSVGGVTIGRADIAFGPFRSAHELIEYQPQTSDGSESTTVEAAILSQGLTNRYTMTLDMQRHAAWMVPVPGAPIRPFNRSGLFTRKLADGNFSVRFVIPQSPAADSGIKTKMTIVAIDGIPASRFANTDVSDLSVGPIGTVRTYTVRDGGATRTVRLRLRELVP